MRIRRGLARSEDGAARDVEDAVPYEAEGKSGMNSPEDGVPRRWCCAGLTEGVGPCEFLFTIICYGKLNAQQKTGLVGQPGLGVYSFFMPSMKCGRARKANSIAWLRSPLISLLNQSTSMPKAI